MDYHISPSRRAGEPVRVSSGDERTQRVTRLEDRVAHQAALLDRLLLAPSAAPAVVAAQFGTTSSPPRAVINTTELGGSPSPGGVRVELSLLQMRTGAIEDRLKSLEAIAARCSSRVEDVAERAHTESRTVEALAVTVRQLQSTLLQQGEVIADMERRMERHFEMFDDRLVHLIEQRIAVRVDAAVSAALAADRKDAETKARSVEDRFRHMEQDLRDSVRQNGAMLTAALRTVQRHVDDALDRATSESLRRLDNMEASRMQSAADHRRVIDEVAKLEESTAALKADIVHLQHRSTELQLRASQWDEEARGINRRLASALRHLAVDHAVAAPALLNVSGASESTKQPQPGHTSDVVHAVTSVQAPTPSIEPLRQNPTQGSPIDEFLSEMDAALKRHVSY